jgi:hypothetical protein
MIYMRHVVLESISSSYIYIYIYIYDMYAPRRARKKADRLLETGNREVTRDRAARRGDRSFRVAKPPTPNPEIRHTTTTACHILPHR